MKKKHVLNNALEWFKDAGLKVFAVVLLLAGGFYVYAISWPVTQPNDTTGVVGTFVGASEYDAPSNGFFNAGSDYKTVNKYCSQEGRAPANVNATLKYSHICTPDEMLNTYNHMTSAQETVLLAQAATGKTLWINSGPPGFTANANDCKGWSTVASPQNNMNYGTLWNFSTKSGGLLPCTTGKKFACCK
jgi:hypothetical protein